MRLSVWRLGGIHLRAVVVMATMTRTATMITTPQTLNPDEVPRAIEGFGTKLVREPVVFCRQVAPVASFMVATAGGRWQPSEALLVLFALRSDRSLGCSDIFFEFRYQDRWQIVPKSGNACKGRQLQYEVSTSSLLRDASASDRQVRRVPPRSVVEPRAFHSGLALMAC